jgi:uncharacterized membrane protein
MDLRLIWALILTIMPVTELRAGLPVAIVYAMDNNIPILLVFSLIILLNILMIFVIFYLLDFAHKFLKNIEFFRTLAGKFINRFQKKVDKFEKKYETLGFIALVLFVAVPLPGTGAWSGCLVAWLLGLERKRSISAIALGVAIAGILILIGTLGFFNLFLG